MKKIKIIICLCFLSVGNYLLAQSDTFLVNNHSYVRSNGDWYVLNQYNEFSYRVDPEIITVRFHDWVSEIQKTALHSSFNCTVIRTNILGFVDIGVRPGDEVIQVLQLYINSGLCQVAELNTFGEVFACSPDDVHYLNNNQWYLNQINMPAAWNIETGDPSIVVAIIEGYDFNHEDIGFGTDNYSNVWLNPAENGLDSAGFDASINQFDDDGNGFVDDYQGWKFTLGGGSNDLIGGFDSHGTSIAGIVAAKTNNNSQGIAGIAGGCGNEGVKLMNLAYNPAFASAVVDDAICYAAITGAHIISLSVGVSQSNCIDAALQFAYEQKGVLIISAAGNNGAGVDPPNSICYPATESVVMAVGATNMSDQRANFSSHGPQLEIAAPGVSMFTTRSVDTYDYAPGTPCTGCGTSFSAPVVSGVAALMLSANPSLSNVALRAKLQCTSDKVGGYTYTDGRSIQLGYGRVNAEQALQAANGTFYVTTITSGNSVVWTDPTIRCDLLIQTNASLVMPADVLLEQHVTVTIENGGTLIISNGATFQLEEQANLFSSGMINIGSGGRLEVQASADAFIQTGGTLELQDGAELFIHDGAVLNVESGGELILKNQTPGKGIVLGDVAGPQTAELKIEGTLSTDPNIDLNFSGEGFINFSGTNSSLNLGQLGIIGLTGAANDDLLMQISDNANITISVDNGVIFTNGIVKVTGNATLNIDAFNFIVLANGTLEVESSGTVELNSGGTLRMFNNGLTSILHGGKLQFNNGANIFLQDDESLLEIKGILAIDDNTDFTFTGNGFIRLNSPLVQAGTNSRLLLEGAGVSDKVLEVIGNTELSSDLVLFRILNGNAFFQGGRLEVSGPLTLDEVLFTEVFTISGSEGLLVHGQNGIDINNCTFDGVPVWGTLYLGNSTLPIRNTIIQNCSTGLKTYGGSVLLTNVSLINNTDIGWKAEGLEYPSLLTDCLFDGNNTGMHVASSTGALVKLLRTDVLANSTGLIGVVSVNVALDVKCGSVKYHLWTGFHCSANSTLNMSIPMYAGFVDASENKWSTIYVEDAYLYLANGYNNFFVENSGWKIINGSLAESCPTANPTDPFILNVDNNQWYDPQTSSGSIQPADYDLTATPDCPVQLEDNDFKQPVACGSISPCSFGPLFCIIGPNNCTNCPVMQTADFNGILMNEAVDIAINNMELVDNTKDDLTAVNMFHQILTSQLDRSDPDISFLAKYAYSQMNNALRNAFVTGKITEADNLTSLHPSLQEVRDVQDSLTETLTQENFLRHFYLEVDKADMYRLAGKRNTCLQRLNAIDNCYLRQQERLFLNRQIAIVDAENLFLTGQVTQGEFEELLAAAPHQELPRPTLVDSTVSLDNTVSIGTGTTISANTSIGSNSEIGDDVTIGENVTISEGVVIESNTTVGENTTIEMNTTIGENTTIADNVEINKDATIGDNVIIEDNVHISKDVVIGDNVTLREGTFLKKDVQISDGACIESNVRIGMTTTIGTNAIVGENSKLGNNVLIGDESIIEDGVTLNNGAEIGTGAVVESGSTIGMNASICDGETSGNVSNNGNVGSCTSPTAPTDPASVVLNCDFAIARTDMHHNFFNGFSASENGSDTLCVNSTIIFRPDQFSQSYFWDFGDCVTSTEESPAHEYSQPGVYIIKLVQDLNCTLDTLIGAVSVFPKPQPSFTLSASCDLVREITFSRSTQISDFSPPGCFEQTTECLSFTPLDTSRLRVKYNWDFGTGLFQPLEEIFSVSEVVAGIPGNISRIYPLDESFVVSLTTLLQILDLHDNVWKDLGCAVTFSDELNTSQNIQADFTTDSILCRDKNVSFVNTSTGGTSPHIWSWDFDNGQLSSEEDPTSTYSTNGNFTVKLIANEALGCSDSIEKTISILPLPEAGFSFAINGLEVSFTDLSSNTTTYIWDFGDGSLISSDQEPVHSYEESGTFTVCQVVLSSCGIDSLCQEVTVIGGFQKAYGGTGSDKGLSVINTSDGGFASVGTTNSFGAGNLDVIATKTDATGTVIWSKTYGGNRLEDANTIRQTSDGGYIIGGRTKSFGVNSLNKGMVIKIDVNGDVEWSKVFTQPQNLFFSVIRELSGGGYAIVGNTGEGGGGRNILFAKLDALGNEVFVKAIGGSGSQFGRHLDLTSDGGFMILGDTRAIPDIDLLAIKLDASGTIEWSNSYSGALFDIGISTAEVELFCTNDGGFVFSGFTTSFGVGGSDGVMLKVDSLGNLLWAKTYGGVNNDILHSVKEETGTQNLIACGRTNSFGSGLSDIYFVKTDSEGNLLESKTFGGSGNDDVNSSDDIFQITPDGGVIITGYTSSFGAGGNDLYLIKTGPDGSSGCNEVSPVATQVTTVNPTVTAVTHPVSSSFFTVVAHSLSVSDPAIVETSICPLPQAKMGNTGGNSGEGKEVIAEEGSGKELAFDNSLSDERFTLNIYPNPFSDVTVIAAYITPDLTNAEIMIIDLLGTVVNRFDLKAGHNFIEINGSDLSSGIYFYSLISNGSIKESRKVVHLKLQ